MLFRYNEWKDNNINILLTYFYLWALATQMDFLVFTVNYVFLFLIFVLFASLGYYYNDVCDIKKDALANKYNFAQNHSRVKRLLIIVGLLLGALVLWYFLSQKNEILLLYLAVSLSIFTYSSNLVRLKERPVLSIFNDTFFAQIIPGLILLFTVSSTFYLEYTYTAALFLMWIFVQGAKWITGHHLKDAENDLKSGTNTSVTRFGFEKILILNKIVLPIFETVFFVCFLFAINQYLLLCYVIYLMYAFYLIKPEFKSFLTFKYDPMKDLGYRLLNLFYVRYLGVIVLVFLSLQSSYYLIFLLFHLAFYFSNTEQLYKETFYRLYTSKGGLPFLSKLFNHMLYSFFLIFKIDISQFNDLRLSQRLFRIHNEKIRIPYGHDLPGFIDFLQSKFEEMQNEWEVYKMQHESLGIAIDELSKEQVELNKDKKWKSLFLFGYGHMNNSLAKEFPTLFEFIKKYKKQINLVMISTSEGGKHIPPHKGNNHGVLRMQMGIDVEYPEQCFLRVEDKKYYLKEKEFFVFDDTFEHELFNNSSSHRTVLIIDFFKPLPWFYDRINRKEIKKAQKSDYIQSVIKKLN